MAAETSEFLEHHGIKGQKWGVRRELKRIAKADRRFEKLQGDKHLRQKLIQQAHENSHDDLKKLDDQWASRAQDFGGLKLMPTDYYSEAYKVLNHHLDTLSREYTNASGTRRLKAHYSLDPKTGLDYFVVGTEKLQHSILSSEVKVPVTKNEQGMITDFEFPEELFDLLLDEPLVQSAFKPTEEFLEHHGIKGQKWGIRRNRPTRAFASGPSSNAASPVESIDSADGTDARKLIAKQKKHGTVALTNHELRTLNARQKLEQEFAKANPKEKSKLDKGHEAVKKYLTIGATGKQAYDLFNSSAGVAARKKAKIYKADPVNAAMWKIALSPALGYK